MRSFKNKYYLYKRKKREQMKKIIRQIKSSTNSFWLTVEGGRSLRRI